MARIARFALGLVLLSGGCSDDTGTTPTADSAGTASPAGDRAGATSPTADGTGLTSPAADGVAANPSAGPAQVDDPPGLITCRQVAAALRDATLMDPGVVAQITATSTTADAPVADAAAALADAYAAALAAHDEPEEPDAIAAVSGTAAAMSQVCGDSGLDSVR